MPTTRFGAGSTTRFATGSITRFAPSPTGFLHLGHAYSALFAAERGDQFLLRIEDLDQGRCRPEYVDAIFEDLAWLGLSWPEPVWVQSQRFATYRQALDRLIDQDLIYACTCTRKEITQELARMGGAPHVGEHQAYPGTCRNKALPLNEGALRLDMTRAVQIGAIETGAIETGAVQIGAVQIGAVQIGAVQIGAVKKTDVEGALSWGDVVLARKDVGVAYHLAVVVDDAEQGVTLVTRGEDMADQRPIHLVLQRLLGLPTPHYEHHPLVLGEDGKRLAKRDQSVTLRSLRAAGLTPDGVRELLFVDKALPR